MIVYNNRYRGPFEYEKMLLNILQFSNMINVIIDRELSDNNSNLNNLLYIKEQLNIIFNEISKKNGLSEKLYIEKLCRKGVPYDKEID